MSRSARDRWPISSLRSEKSGISSRALTERRTRSAAAASRRSGAAMVPASSSDRITITSDATMNTLRIAIRSLRTIASISPPGVEICSAPRMVRPRRIGTATVTIISPVRVTRTIGVVCPCSAAATSG